MNFWLLYLAGVERVTDLSLEAVWSLMPTLPIWTTQAASVSTLGICWFYNKCVCVCLSLSLSVCVPTHVGACVWVCDAQDKLKACSVGLQASVESPQIPCCGIGPDVSKGTTKPCF